MTTRRMARPTIALLLSVSTAALLTACGSSGTGSSASSAPVPGESAVRTAMTDLTASGAVPGVIAVVQTPDQRSVITVGKADLGNGAAMTDSATTRIASISKAFSGAVLLSLASQGKLSLNATLAEVLPSVPATWGSATVAQVLQHTSGLPDYIKSPTFIAEFSANTKMEKTPEQLIGYVADQPPAFPPGSAYLYSDTDNIVAGLIAEKITGKPYADLLTEFVDKPLALSQTALPSTTALPDGYIHGYDAVEATPGATAQPAPDDVSELINPALAWASGGMTSTAADLNTFIRGYVGGKLFSAQTVEAQRQFVPGGGGPPGPGTNSSGLAIYRYETPCGTFYGHTGNMPGYTSFVASDATGERSVAVVANTQISPKADEAIYNALLAVENASLCAASGTSSTPTPSST